MDAQQTPTAICLGCFSRGERFPSISHPWWCPTWGEQAVAKRAETPGGNRRMAGADFRMVDTRLTRRQRDSIGQLDGYYSVDYYSVQDDSSVYVQLYGTEQWFTVTQNGSIFDKDHVDFDTALQNAGI